MEYNYKFKVGDKVRIRKDLKVGICYNNVYAPSAMEAFRGKVMTISKLCTYASSPSYHLAEDEKEWYWSDDMLEPVSEPARKRFQPTDTIVITTDGTETRAYHKRGGKVIAESKCMRNPADTHDLRTAADLCIDRLFEEKPAQGAYYNGKVFMVVLEEAWIPVEVKTGHVYEVKDGLFSCFKDHEILCNKRFKTIDEIAEYFDEGALVYEIQGEVLHDK